MTAKEFYENQLHDKTTVVGRLEKDEIIELMQAYHESKMREEKAKKFYDKNTCMVCHQNYVDSANGFDTCDYCLNRI
jgi:hypothetical protein